MNPASIVLYMRWRTGKEGTLLVHANGDPVLGLDGGQIRCVGTWLAPVNVEQCRSAITCAHEARDQSGPYSVPCDNCIAADLQGIYHGCRFHRGESRLWSKGNPKNSSTFKNYLREYLDSTSGNYYLMQGYIARGDTPLLPDQLLTLRTVLLSSNKVWEFQFYTMLLISCRLFLRESEVANMQFSDINPDITTVKQGGRVEGISIRIKGKSDQHPVTLTMWNDDDFPQFCPVRHLLAWIAISKITDGYFFPTKERLQRILKVYRFLTIERSRLA
jgi:hypothetical protein